MQLAMIGLGRMGANMVRRLITAAINAWFSTCLRSGRRFVQAKKRSQPPRLRTSCASWRSRGVWLMVPAAVVDKTIADLVSHLERGDILIDGGTRITGRNPPRQRAGLGKGSTTSTRDQRRRLGPGARLLHDDSVDRKRPSDLTDLQALATGAGDIAPTPGREKIGAPPSSVI